MRSRRIYWRTIELSFCAKWKIIAESSAEPSNCHSARSKAKSQNLIVILRIMKRSPRIYLRTDDGFCNSGRKRSPCRMTRWMADNEFKNPRFCQIHQLPRIFKFSYELSLLTLSFCAKQSEVAESLLYQNITTIPLNCTPLSSISSLLFKFSCEHSKIPKQVFLQLIQWHQS